jgi:hypothetical protein
MKSSAIKNVENSSFVKPQPSKTLSESVNGLQCFRLGLANTLVSFYIYIYIVYIYIQITVLNTALLTMKKVKVKVKQSHYRP